MFLPLLLVITTAFDVSTIGIDNRLNDMTLSSAAQNRAGNYSSAGRSVVKQASQSFENVRSASPNYTDLALSGMKARSAMKQAAEVTGAKFAGAGVEAASTVAKAGLRAGITEAKGKAEVSKIRMAGKLAALGGMGGGLKSSSGGLKRPKAPSTLDLTGIYDKYKSDAQDLRDQADAIGTKSSKKTSGENAKVAPLAADAPVGQKYMHHLISNGYTPQNAAAIVGNARYESANFTAHEEFEPNAYGTKGAGVFQWTGGRRTNFENYAKDNKLDPKSFEANSRFMIHELQGGAHWTPGTSGAGFRGSKSLEDSVTYFQNNYLKPAKATANNAQRQTYAQQALQRWNANNNNTNSAATNHKAAGGSPALHTADKDGYYNINIVDFANRLKNNFGLTPVEHPAFGGVNDVHAHNSHHYHEEGVDFQDRRKDVINGVGWEDRTANLANLLQGSAHEVIGRDQDPKKHWGHLHVGAYGGNIRLNQHQYNYLYGGKSGGLNATFAPLQVASNTN